MIAFYCTLGVIIALALGGLFVTGLVIERFSRFYAVAQKLLLELYDDPEWRERIAQLLRDEGLLH